LEHLTKKKRKKMMHYFFSVSYRDHELAETISTIETSVPTRRFTDEGEPYWDLMEISQGEVVVDSRGRGSFQT